MIELINKAFMWILEMDIYFYDILYKIIYPKPIIGSTM